jgi:nicotinamidase-related amidase
VRPAVIIIDMLQDSFTEPRNPQREEEKIVAPMRDFLKKCRAISIPIIFGNDSFLREDFIFKGRLKPYAIRGTTGERVLPDLEPEPTDITLSKRRFSAFFKTDLDQTLRTYGIDTVAIGGINSHVCVIHTVLDAICHDFQTIILEDMCAAYKREIHEGTMEAHRKSSLYPLLRVMTSGEFLAIYDHAKKV